MTLLEQTQLQTLEITRRGSVLRCAMNRSEVRNAVNLQLHNDLEQFFEEVARDESVRVIVLTGNGRSFCVGGDMAALKTGEFDRHPGGNYTRGAPRIIRNLLHVPQPIISAINGEAVGIGASLALMCDIVIAADNARIGDPHIRAGLVAGDGAALIWPMLMPINRAKELIFTGRVISAKAGLDYGLINHVYPSDDLLGEADRLADELADLPVAALRWTKLAMNKIIVNRMNEVLDLALALEALSGQTQDHREAVAAFLDRRAPKFTGE